MNRCKQVILFVAVLYIHTRIYNIHSQGIYLHMEVQNSLFELACGLCKSFVEEGPEKDERGDYSEDSGDFDLDLQDIADEIDEDIDDNYSEGDKEQSASSKEINHCGCSVLSPYDSRRCREPQPNSGAGALKKRASALELDMVRV